MPIRHIGVALVAAALAVYVALMVGLRVNPPTAPPANDNAPQGAGRPAPRGAIDYPLESTPVLGAASVRGWALDETAQEGTGVDRVRVYLDGAFVADANYGQPRDDISARFGPQFTSSGWVARVDLHGQAWGKHRLAARAHSTLTDAETDYPTTLIVAPPISAPRGAFDFPVDGASQSETTLEVRGWALDQVVEQGTGVDRVSISVDDVAVPQQADYGIPRQDIGSRFGEQFQNAGWLARLDLRGQSLGAHRIDARAHSTFSDYETVYTTSIVITAPPGMPRGAIDVPSDGTEVRGVMEVRGWALDQASPSGSGVDRVRLYLDGLAVGDARYGEARPEIGVAYGTEFQNSAWTSQIDVGEVAPGTHQLEARVHSSYDGQEANYVVSVIVGSR